MVVDHVEQHAKLELMRDVDEGAEIVRCPIEVRGRKEIHTIVAPTELAGKIRQRHDLDDRDTDVDQIRQPLDRGTERSTRCEGTDMELVEYLPF